jgi:hypothetical protein
VEPGTHLDADLERSKELQLVLRNKLGEGDEEPNLQSGETMVRQTIPARVSLWNIG